MPLYDVLIRLDEEDRIAAFTWNDDYLERTYAAIWTNYVERPVQALLAKFGGEERLLAWQEEKFSWAVVAAGGARLLLLKRETDRIYLYQNTLDTILEGIQIYDKNACVVYINKASREISGIPEQIEVEGRHLLDLYDLDEDISTVMTSLRTGAPVINRFDVFRSTERSNITTTNTAYPIFQNGNLVGSIVFEQDSHVVERQIEQLQNIQKVMARKSGTVPSSKFMGYSFRDVIGSDEKLTAAVELAQRIASQSCNVLLVGETGTGKEIFAQSIHRASDRREHKFVAINCAAIPDQLIEGLFFGTKKGSYTGSIDQVGYVEEADKGTLFLDELNSMSLSMQAKILRVIQEGVFRRVGGTVDTRVDLRVIASCNEDPFRLISENRLRKDLFYRLSTVLIDLPPLREHPGDIDELIAFYMEKRSFHYVKAIPEMGEEVKTVLRGYPWPGNVRELFHVLDHVLNVVSGDKITLEHLPKYIRTAQAVVEEPVAEAADSWLNSDLQHILDTHEERVLRAVLEHHGYNITKAADALGLRRQSLQYRIKKLGIVF